MKVKELIDILEQCDPEAIITVWNSFRDCEDENVHISHIFDDIHIGICVYDEEITLNSDDK